MTAIAVNTLNALIPKPPTKFLPKPYTRKFKVAIAFEGTGEVPYPSFILRNSCSQCCVIETRRRFVANGATMARLIRKRIDELCLGHRALRDREVLRRSTVYVQSSNVTVRNLLKAESDMKQEVRHDSGLGRHLVCCWMCYGHFTHAGGR